MALRYYITNDTSRPIDPTRPGSPVAFYPNIPDNIPWTGNRFNGPGNQRKWLIKVPETIDMSGIGGVIDVAVSLGITDRPLTAADLEAALDSQNQQLKRWTADGMVRAAINGET